MQITQTKPTDLNQPSDTPSSSATESEATTTDLPLDVMFDILSNERRRRVLRYLLNESDSTTLGDLAEYIAGIENEKPENELSSTERKRVYICLYQCHLPKLDDAGVIDFDEHRKTITSAPGITQLKPYLTEKEEPTTVSGSRSKYYLGLSIVGLTAFIAQSIIFSSAWLSGLILGMLLATVGIVSLGRLL